MIAFIKHLQQRWNDWCGDRDMELAIRRHLTANGYYGGRAKLRNVRLVAVQRPGWLQVFRFEATARLAAIAGQPDEADCQQSESEYRQSESEYRQSESEHRQADSGGQPQDHELYGLVRDDIRHKISVVRVFESTVDRRELFARWSDGLICLRGAHGLNSQDSP